MVLGSVVEGGATDADIVVKTDTKDKFKRMRRLYSVDTSYGGTIDAVVASLLAPTLCNCDPNATLCRDLVRVFQSCPKALPKLNAYRKPKSFHAPFIALTVDALSESLLIYHHPVTSEAAYIAPHAHTQSGRDCALAPPDIPHSPTVHADSRPEAHSRSWSGVEAARYTRATAPGLRKGTSPLARARLRYPSGSEPRAGL